MTTADRADRDLRKLRTRLAALEQKLDTARASENRLAARAAEISAVLEATADGIVSVVEDGTIATLNPAAEAIFGYREDELLGHHILELAPPSEHEAQRAVLESCAKASEPGLIQRKVEVQGLKKDGTVFPFELSVYRVHGEDRVFITGIMHDLTERRAIEEALVGVSEAVRESIGQELHDVLGQQLTGIALMTKGLENSLRPADAERAEEAREIGQLVQTALSEAKRLAHGLYPTELERHGLAAALAELAFAQEKLFGIRCRLHGRVDSDRISKMQALHLYRIAQEAMSNAVKHAETRCIDVTLSEPANAIALEVRDEGAGWQNDTRSAGMGLMIMQYRAHLIGARVSIAENERGGTTVACILPLEPTPGAPEDRA